MHQVRETNSAVGIDLGIKDFVITSEGEVFGNLHFKKTEKNKIRKLQRQLSRKQKGSNNRNKAKIRLAKVYKKINDIIITTEELEKTSTSKIIRNIEYENIKNNNTEKNVDKHENYEKIRNILISKLGNKEINEESNIILDLGADSLDLVEIFLLLEKEFGIKIEKEQRRGIREVKDLMNMVNKSIKLK